MGLYGGDDGGNDVIGGADVVNDGVDVVNGDVVFDGVIAEGVDTGYGLPTGELTVGDMLLIPDGRDTLEGDVGTTLSIPLGMSLDNPESIILDILGDALGADTPLPFTRDGGGDDTAYGNIAGVLPITDDTIP